MNTTNYSAKDIENKILIGAWGTPPPDTVSGKDRITDENYLAMKESGIEFFCCLYELGNLNHNLRALELAQKYGVKLFLNIRDIAQGSKPRREIEAQIEQYKKLDSFLGIAIRDEPGINEFEKLEGLIKIYSDIMDDRMFYCNLMPMYASKEQLFYGFFENKGTASVSDYKTYVSKFAETVNLPMLSYDFYPFREEYGKYDTNYFKQLFICKGYADKKGVPLWCFIQVTSWQRDSIRRVGYTEISWQVCLSLACGAKGIQYFTYITPIDAHSEYFDTAMTDREMEKTDRYYHVQKINRHIKNIAGFLGSATLCGVLGNGSIMEDVPAERVIDSFYGVTVQGGTYFMGCFTQGGKNAVYIVNPSLYDEQTYTLTAESDISRIYILDSESSHSGKQVTFKLGAGEGSLIVLS